MAAISYDEVPKTAWSRRFPNGETFSLHVRVKDQDHVN